MWRRELTMVDTLINDCVKTREEERTDRLTGTHHAKELGRAVVPQDITELCVHTVHTGNNKNPKRKVKSPHRHIAQKSNQTAMSGTYTTTRRWAVRETYTEPAFRATPQASIQHQHAPLVMINNVVCSNANRTSTANTLRPHQNPRPFPQATFTHCARV
jgi:hypothetical protein